METTPITSMPGHLIRRLQQIAVSVFAAHMKAAELDLTPVQFATLDTLARNPGVDQATLAGQIAYDRATMGGVIDRLATRGLIDRAPDPDDRRARRLSLTEKGSALLAAARPVVTMAQTDILPGLTEAEQVHFVRLLEKTTTAGNALSRAPLSPPSEPVKEASGRG